MCRIDKNENRYYVARHYQTDFDYLCYKKNSGSWERLTYSGTKYTNAVNIYAPPRWDQEQWSGNVEGHIFAVYTNGSFDLVHFDDKKYSNVRTMYGTFFGM